MAGAKRDETWFDASYRLHEHAVRSYAVRRVGSGQADDIVAETFTTLWRRRSAAPVDRLLPWLYGVAANHIAHLIRARQRGDRLTERLANHEATRQPEDLGWSVPEIFASLPETDAELLRLAYWEDLSPRDIAVVVGCSVGAARVRLHRARKRARDQLAAGIEPTGLVPDSETEVLK